MRSALPLALLAITMLGSVCNIGAAELSPATPSPAEPATPNNRVLPLDVTVNGVKSGTWPLIEHAGALYAPRDAFEEWRLLLDTEHAQPITFRGEQYWPLSAVPGYKSKINSTDQSLELLFSPQAFAATRLTSAVNKRLVVDPVLPSLTLSYDLNYSNSYQRTAASTQNLGGLFEIGLSTSIGVLTSTASALNLTNDPTQGQSQWLRLETTLTRDFPEENKTLRLGDTSTRTTLLGRTVYYGGVQFGTNFALTPGYVTQPIPALTGLSASPSTVELYVNNVLRQVSDVPTGPFAIDNFPVMTGNGDVRMVVRDLLGRETVIQKSFFTSSQMLAPGLNDWSVDAGKIRLGLGSVSDDYGQSFASGLWRHGINDGLTVEGRAVAATGLDGLGLGVIGSLPFHLLGKAAITGSQGKDWGSGTQGMLGLEYQEQRVNAAVEVQEASIDYGELGEEFGVTPIKRQVAGNLNYDAGRVGNFGIGYAMITRYNEPSVKTLSANYSMRVGERSNLTFTVSRAVTGSGVSTVGFNNAVTTTTEGVTSTAVGVSLVIPLDGNRFASAYVSNTGGQQDAYATYAQNPDLEKPLGWRVLGGMQQNQSHEEGGVIYLGQYGNLTGDASTTPDQTNVRLGTSGSLIATDNHLFATRRSTNSFAVAEVKDYADVGVGIGNDRLTKTDTTGIALIPNLTAYQKNSIRLNADDLPLSADLETIEQYVVPPWRGGVKVVFPVRNGRAALLKIQFEDGEPAPAGAIVQIEGDKHEFMVARRGEAFVTGLKPVDHLLLNWNDQQCKFDVTLPPLKGDEIPRLGPLMCKGIKR